MICKTIRPSFKGSLPKLHISQDEIKRKIGNVDSKWRVSIYVLNKFKFKTKFICYFFFKKYIINDIKINIL